ncbi:MAG: TIM barrel protein [Candidatus Atribacteria bacterium]|nr:TIM barrel protein [Candidatus Atribacteria bacterium]
MNNQEKTPKSLTVYVGVKSDPIQYRYSFEWLFDLMAEENVFHLQLGSFTELFFLSDSYFEKLRATAESRRITISSVFTSHRELGGFLVEDPEFARITMRNSRRLIEIAEIVGSPVAGSSMGGVYRDRLWYRQEGVRRYIEGMKELMHDAKEHGLSWLTVEPMSCYAEPPCHSQEMISLMEEFRSYHAQNEDDTVQFGLCSDVLGGWSIFPGFISYYRPIKTCFPPPRSSAI